MTKVARRIRKLEATRIRGLEATVDTAAVVVLIVGGLFACLSLLTLSLAGLFSFLLGCLTTFLGWLLLRCLAEIIRLLKMQNGVPYQGRISTQVLSDVQYACEACGSLLHSDDLRDGCGARIVSGDETTKE